MNVTRLCRFELVVFLIGSFSAIGCRHADTHEMRNIVEKSTTPTLAICAPVILSKSTPTISYPTLSEIVQVTRKHSHLLDYIILEFAPADMRFPHRRQLPELVLVYLPLRDSVYAREKLAERNYTITHLPSHHVAALSDTAGYNFQVDSSKADSLLRFVKRRMWNYPLPAVYHLHYFQIDDRDSVVFTHREIQQPFYVFSPFLP